MPSLIRRLFLLVACTACPLVASALDQAELQKRYTAYHAAGKAVVEMAITKNLPPAAVAAKVDVMVEHATWMARAYAEQRPEGAKLLGLVCEHVPAMRKLTFEQLEHDWHDLGWFQQPGRDAGLDLTAEENEHFTDPIHAIVHPLLVLKAAESYAQQASAEALANVKEEMEEGLEQLEKLQTVLRP